ATPNSAGSYFASCAGRFASGRQADGAAQHAVQREPVGDGDGPTGPLRDQPPIGTDRQRLVEPRRAVPTKKLRAETAPVEVPVAHRPAVEVDKARTRIPPDPTALHRPRRG